jgi:hypothetical protein
MQFRGFSARQWRIAARVYVIALLLMGVIGETLPGASAGRVVPLAWWNWVTLAVSPLLIALIAATFVPTAGYRRGRRTGRAATGAGGAIGTLAMACPVCNPLAIPLFGTAGVLSFVAPERGLIALSSMVLLALTLVIRLRTLQTCRVESGRDQAQR